MTRIKCTATIGLTLIVSLFSQHSPAQDARQYLQQSLAAYGAWNNIKTIDYSVAGSRDAGAQGKTYKSGEQQSYTASRIYDLSNRQLYETNRNTFPGGYAFHFATLVKDTTAYNYDIDGTRGGKVYNTAGKTVAEGRYKVINNHLAYFKVLDLLQQKDSLEWKGADTSASITITRWNAQKERVGTYYFAPQTKLLEKVSANQGGQVVDMLFGAYQHTNGRQDNGLVQVLVNGKLNTTEKITVNKVGFTFDTNLLTLPKNYIANKVQEPSKPIAIAKDIYLIERLAGDRNVLFVNMDEYITVIEAPISAALSQQVIQMIREVAPGKPIRYVFTTHYHSDHTGGLRQYAFEGAQLLMAAPTQAYVTDLLANKTPDDWGKSGRAAAPFITVTNTYILEDANHRIEFHEVPNSHADGMALAYFPNEKLIYQGDLLSMPLDGTLPHALEVTKDMQRFLEKKGFSYNRMIGHHGHNNMTPLMVQQVLKNVPVSKKEK